MPTAGTHSVCITTSVQLEYKKSRGNRYVFPTVYPDVWAAAFTGLLSSHRILLVCVYSVNLGLKGCLHVGSSFSSLHGLSQTETVFSCYFWLDNSHQYCTDYVYMWVWGKVQVGWGIDVCECAVERIKVSWSTASSKLRCAVCTFCECVCVCVSWQQLGLGAEFVSHKRFTVAWSPKIPVQWSVSFQVLNSSDWSGGFISSPWAAAATRVIRQPKSTLGVAKQPSGGGRQAVEASWPLVCGLLANQLALLSFFFFFFFPLHGPRRS